MPLIKGMSPLGANALDWGRSAYKCGLAEKDLIKGSEKLKTLLRVGI